MSKIESDPLRILNKPFFLLGWAMVLLLASELPAVEGGAALSDERWGFVLNIRSDAGSCSAARVSEKYAVTAAHCVDGSPIRVYTGALAEQFVGLAKTVFVDPRYANRGHDVAVIEIQSQSTAPVVTVPIAPSARYRDLLAGKYPNRKTLVAGFGNDGQDRIGQRKWAFERSLSIFPSPEFAGEIHSSALLGATRPGDSGGPILIRTGSTELFELFGVVSGENIWNTTDEDGETLTDAIIIRNAPVAPSLCLASGISADELGFDDTACAATREFEDYLYGDEPYTTLDSYTLLWRAVQASRSIAAFEVETVQRKADEYAIASFESQDSLFARRYFSKRIIHGSWHRSMNLLDRSDLLNRLIGAARNHGQIFDSGQSFGRSSDVEKVLTDFEHIRNLVRRRPAGRSCGQTPCMGNFFSGTTAKSSDAELDWDFLTTTNDVDEALNFNQIQELICLGFDTIEKGGETAEDLKDTLESIGFAREFISFVPASETQEFSLSVKSNSLEINIDGYPNELYEVTINGSRLSEANMLIDGAVIIEHPTFQKAMQNTSGLWGSRYSMFELTSSTVYIQIPRREKNRINDVPLVAALGCATDK